MIGSCRAIYNTVIVIGNKVARFTTLREKLMWVQGSSLNQNPDAITKRCSLQTDKKMADSRLNPLHSRLHPFPVAPCPFLHPHFFFSTPISLIQFIYCQSLSHLFIAIPLFAILHLHLFVSCHLSFSLTEIWSFSFIVPLKVRQCRESSET